MHYLFLGFLLAGILGAVIQAFCGDDGAMAAMVQALFEAADLAVEVMHTHGVDSLAGRLAAVMQGSTETTFYVLAVYFGSVGVTRMRHALVCGLVADGAGLITAIFVTYLFFGG